MKIGSHKGVKYAVTFSKEKFDKVVAFSVAHWKIIAGVLAALVLLACGDGVPIDARDKRFVEFGDSTTNQRGGLVGSHLPELVDRLRRLGYPTADAFSMPVALGLFWLDDAEFHAIRGE